MFLLFILVLFSSEIYSADLFVPGKVILTERDTIEGFIEYTQFLRNPNKIVFKKEMDGDIDTYTPASIVGFNVNNEIYRTSIVDREVRNNITNYLTDESEYKIIRDTVFLLLLIDGPKKLYTYTDKVDGEVFYIKNGDDYLLLLFKRYLATEYGNTVIKTKNKYLGQLAYYLRDCSEAQNILEPVAYKRKDLVKAFLKYYKCISSESVYTHKAPRGKKLTFF